MAQHGLLIDYEFCTGCHSCEMACKVEKNLKIGYKQGEYGIKLAQLGPWPLDEEAGTWEFDYIPMPTQRCDMCQELVDAGKVPVCVHHCQGLCMQFGDIEELAKKVTKPRMVIFSVK